MDPLLMVLLLLWSSGLQAEGKHKSTGAQCETTAKADIVLLVDTSSSVSKRDFNIIKSFIKRLVSVFDIGPDRVQIGLVLYAGDPLSMWDLNTYQTKYSLLEAIDSVTRLYGDTLTGQALDYILHNSFQSNVGMRADSQKIAVLITDGKSQDDIFLRSQNLTDAGIEVYAIGLNDADKNELRSIASDPDEIHMYYVDGSSSLKDIIGGLTINICNSANSLGLQAEGKHKSTGAQCETTAKADIVLLVDTSSSVSNPDFDIIKSFIKRLVNVFDIGPDRVQIGLVLYAGDPQTECDLKTYQTKYSLLEAIDRVTRLHGDTYTGKALDYILHNSFKPNVGMRADSQKIAVLITDGKSTDIAHIPSQNLKDAGIEVYAIGLNDADKNELRSIASDPDEIHMYYVDGSSSLKDIIGGLTINICNSANSLGRLSSLNNIHVSTTMICCYQNQGITFLKLLITCQCLGLFQLDVLVFQIALMSFIGTCQ
ncbi:matrilin-1-like [Epinephelus lanceolatus]